MAEWKKVVVSGSSANLANVQVDSLSSGVVTGAGGNLTTTAINGAGNIVATTGASGLVHTGSFTGSFTGDGSGITGLTTDGSIVDGNGIADFTYDGSSNVVIKVDSGSLAGAGLGTNNSTLTVNVDDTGIEINSDTLRLKDDGVTAAKLDDVFTNGGGVAGTFGSTTAVPKLTIDGQGRITTASLETIATSFDIAADSGTSDTVNGGETLTFAGGTGVSTTVSNNNIAINIASGIISSSTQIDALFNLDGIVSASAFTSPSRV